jgi:hypothetical protein
VLVVRVEIMVNVFRVMAVFIVNVISDILEIDANVSYKYTVFRIACNAQFCMISGLVCMPNPCTNGGTCEPRPNGVFHCQCTSEYEGQRCEFRRCFLC